MQTLVAPERSVALGEPVFNPASDYADLKRRVLAAGLLEKRPTYYSVKIAVTLLFFVVCAAAVSLIEGWAFRLLAVLVLAVASGQVAFLGHDAAHQQIVRGSKRSTGLGLLFYNLLLGVSVSWWKDDHNRHHAFSNQDGLDPNLDIPVFALTTTQANQRRGLMRWFAQHQVWLFFPMLSLEGFSAHLSSVKFILAGRSRLPWIEGGLIALHVVGYVGLFLWQGVLEGLLLALVHQLASGLYLASTFAPNHKGMPTLPAEASIDFLKRQVLTSRNVNPHPLVDLFYGGLNYQVEHHLFPTMARNQLRAVQQMVADFCAEKGLPYHSTSVIGSYREILGHMRRMSADMAT